MTWALFLALVVLGASAVGPAALLVALAFASGYGLASLRALLAEPAVAAAEGPREPCCRSRRERPLSDGERTLAAWARVVRRARRLAFVRRLWGHLGQWLCAVKRAGEGFDSPLFSPWATRKAKRT